MTLALHRLAPAAQPAAPIANLDAEAALLSAMLLDRRAIDAAADALSPEDFADALNRRIFAVILREHALDRPVSPPTLAPFLADDPDLRAVGGMAYLVGLTTVSVVPLLVLGGLIAQLRELGQRRRLQAGLAAVAARADDFDLAVADLVAQTDDAIVAAAGGIDRVHQPSAGQCIQAVLAAQAAPVRGTLCTRIPALDALLGHLRPTQLIVAAGRPGIGKTAMAVSYALGAALAGHGVLYVSLEMSGIELGERMAADLCFDGRTGVPYNAITGHDLDPGQHACVARAGALAADLPLQLVDIGHLTPARLAMMVRRWKRRFAARGRSLELVIVDYLQLLSGSRKAMSEYDTVTEASRELKRLAKEEGLAVMALAQLSREVEKRPDKRPQLSDLRSSGQIEQDADGVLFLYRPDHYLRQDEPEPGHPDRRDWEASLAACQGVIEFICAKRRAGITGTRHGLFHADYQAVRG